MAQSVSIRRSLLHNLLVVIALLGGAIAAISVYGTRELVATLSQALTREALDTTQSRLQQFFEPMQRELLSARDRGQAGLLEAYGPESLNNLFRPFMQQYPQVSSVLVADGRGREYMLHRTGERWLNRETRRDEWGPRVRWIEWPPGQGAPVVTWRALDYDPRTRAWYRGAIASLDPAAEGGGPVYWSEPYVLYLSRNPGITVAGAYRPADGGERVVALDIDLAPVRAFLHRLRVGATGRVFVLTDGGRILAVSRGGGAMPPPEELLLRHANELEWPLAGAVYRALSLDPEARDRPVRFESGDGAYWGQRRDFRLGTGRGLQILVAIPEADLLGRLPRVGALLFAALAVILVLAVLRAMTLARRYSEPIEALVTESDRISRGDLDRGIELRSGVSEVRRLAAAHERMRHGLKSLMRIENDLRLARQIQRSTLPRRLPEVTGFDIDAWSEPAEETGGDIYDVVGLHGAPGVRDPRPATESPDRVALLLADATGHGIGPALSATQVRAMVRMALRDRAELADIARHVNEQLHEDLFGGRFITAWIGVLDVRTRRLTGFSAGQAPLIHYRAADDRCETLPADAPPLGVLPDLEVRLPAARTLRPGDVFAVLSDGVFDARDPGGTAFGVDRVCALLAREHARSSAEILDALRDELARFTRGAASLDDRTAVLVKCTARGGRTAGGTRRG